MSIYIYIYSVVNTSFCYVNRYSGNVLRTTHISGSVTDMGLIIGRKNFTLTAPMWKFYINLSIVSCFFLGALVGGYSSKDLGDDQLLVNVSLYAAIALLYFIMVKKEKEYRCLTSLGSTAKPEEDSDPQVSQLPQSEVSVEKHVENGHARNIADDVSSETPPPTADNNEDSDEEEDPEEPLDNQLTEEDKEDLERYQAEGRIESIKSRDDLLHGVKMTAITSIEDPLPTNETNVVSAVDTTVPKKEMENAWTFRVMMFVVCMLCFNAAFINATTKLSSKALFTSHITGA